MLAPLFVLASGCGTILIKGDVMRQSDGWTLVLQRLIDGPNQTGTGNTIYEPEPGQRFIHAWIKFKNDSPQTRVFSYDACDLDMGDELLLPGVVIRYNGIATEIKRNETYPPGDVSYRILTFSYPVGHLPTRLKCGLTTFELPSPVPMHKA